MAVARLRHIDIFFTKHDKGKILSLVQRLGVIQLIQVKEVLPARPAGGPIVQRPDWDLERIQDTIDYLDTFSPAKKGLLAVKPTFRQAELDRLLKDFDIGATINQLGQIKEALKSIETELDRLDSAKEHLSYWEGLKVALKDLEDNRYVEALLGIINIKRLAALNEDLKKNGLSIYLEVISQRNSLAYLFIICLKSQLQEIHSIFKRYDFHHVTLEKKDVTPKEAISEIDTKITQLTKKRQDLYTRINLLLPKRLNLMILLDKLNNEKIREGVSLKLLETDYVSLISGWIKQKDLPHLLDILSRFPDVELIARDPLPDEDVPVELENKRLIQPFEFITKIYGMPKYNEVDPTPFLAPFFFLYFGFCVSDVGYGLILALVSLFILKRFKMGPQGVRFFRLFLFCGVSTMIVGALTGGWFGNLFDLLSGQNKIFLPLKKFKDSLIILDPLEEPTRLLGIALSFGIVQVWFGNIVAGIGNLKNRRYLNLVLDQVPMLTFLFGLTGLGLIFLRLLSSSYINIFRYPALIGALALMLTQGRSEKTIGSKLFYGMYNLYSAFSGYLSDILSYSRLWALGLVTGVMATTINLISIQFSQILPDVIPFINKIGFIKAIISSLVLIVIFSFGHIISFLMNLLGAFVHPLRLQFVEFFSKFFKAGGSSFRPFKIETKYINISEDITYGTK